MKTVETLHANNKKKTVAEGVLDSSLIMTNATQLNSLLSLGDSYRYYHLLMALLIMSILLEVAIGMMLIYLGAMEGKKKENSINRMNNATLLLGFIVGCMNVFITAFGVDLKSG